MPVLDGKPAVTAALPARRVVIPTIGLDSKVIQLGTTLDRRGQIAWETAPFAVGQHKGLAGPGQNGNMVLSGHISSPNEGAVFHHLPELKLGEGVIVSTEERQFLYRVDLDPDRHPGSGLGPGPESRSHADADHLRPRRHLLPPPGRHRPPGVRAAGKGDGFFQEDARGDGVGRQRGVVAERRAVGEAVAAVQAECVDLLVAGFEAEGGEVGRAGFGFEAVEDGSRDAQATGGGADVHAFDLGEAIEQRDAATAGRGAVEGCDEEAHVRLEDSFERQPVAVLGRVFSGQDVFEFPDQQADGIVWDAR